MKREVCFEKTSRTAALASSDGTGARGRAQGRARAVLAVARATQQLDIGADFRVFGLGLAFGRISRMSRRVRPRNRYFASL